LTLTANISETDRDIDMW